MNRRRAELVLGTVQLGVPYGAANRNGMPPRETAIRLLRRAASLGIAAIDTARAYGDAENRIGTAFEGSTPVETITKLDPLSRLPDDASPAEAEAAADESVARSLVALKRTTLDTLLLHRARHVTSHGGAIWRRLNELRQAGVISRIGVSVQSPEEAHLALAAPGLGHIQLPFNVLDWRWAERGVIEVLRRRDDVTVHARGPFLQGLLACDDPALWPRVPGVDATRVLFTLNSLARALNRRNAADLCLAYARGQDFIHGVVIGMETEDQLSENMRLFVERPLSTEECSIVANRMPRVPVQLLDPAQWPAREAKGSQLQ